MAESTRSPVEAGLRTLFEVGTVVGRSDGELLDRFLAAGGPAAELAFAALVERHGPMVWRVCRDVLREPNDADDAFQATFLVLARRAGAIRSRSSLGPWLHGVALRVARCARSVATRRRHREAVAAERKRHEGAMGIDASDAAPILHEEVDRLPEKYRSPLVLCYFQGLTHDQAAGQLGWPVGTVRSRLAAARDRLRPRLLRRGIAPSVAILVTAGRANAAVTVPAPLVSGTIRMAVGVDGTVPAPVADLCRMLHREMVLMKCSILATGLAVAAAMATAGMGYVAIAARPQVEAKVVTPVPDGRPRNADAAPVIRLATVEPRDITVTQAYVCRIESHHHIEVRAPESGAVESIGISEGQAVKRGDLLFQVRPIAGGEGDARATRISAPFDGMIGRLRCQQGGLVLKGEALTSLFDNGVMWAYFQVPEGRYFEYMAERGRDEKVPEAELTLANGNKFPEPGKISAIDAKFDSKTGTIAFRADFTNPGGVLRHGQTGTLSLRRVLKDAIVIDQRATLESLGKRYVYVVGDDEIAHRRNIVIRNETEDGFVIHEGVGLGDKIVLEGAGSVHDGQKVSHR